MLHSGVFWGTAVNVIRSLHRGAPSGGGDGETVAVQRGKPRLGLRTPPKGGEVLKPGEGAGVRYGRRRGGFQAEVTGSELRSWFHPS